MKSTSKKAVKILLCVLAVALLAAGTVLAARWVMSLRDPQNLAEFQQWIRSLGFGGWLLLVVIQYIQIVVALIPGGPIQIVSGALFGPVGGLATCMLGMVLATATVFALVNRYGHRVIRLFVKEKELSDYKFLNNSKRVETLVAVLFLIPGTPKDALTYLFALTPISLTRFLLISTLARIPAALTSVLAGDSIAAGNWFQALVMFIIITAIGVAGFFAHRKVLQFHHRQKR